MQRHRQVTRHYISAPDLTRFVRSWATTIDNRILLSRHHSQVSLHRQKKTISRRENMVDTSKDWFLFGRGICHITATLQFMGGSKQVPTCLRNIV